MRQQGFPDLLPESGSARVQPRRVAILIESSTSWGTGVIRGIARYAAEHGPWVFYLEPLGRNQTLRMPEGWTGDGVLARVNSRELADDIEHAGVPCVDLSWFGFSEGRFANCTVDEVAVGRLVASHLLERGLRNLAYVPPLQRQGYANLLGQTVERVAREAGCECAWYERPEGERVHRPWRAELEGLIDWLRSLPKPVGVVAFGDFSARQVTEACWLAGLAVPDEVAVVGSEQDELSSLISNPPLSSVDVGSVRVGYAAAELLDGLMRGEPLPAGPVLLAPVGIITRRSSDVLATTDEIVAQACQFMRANAHRPIHIDHVVEHCAVSRRTLEQRFAAVLDRTPARMLRRIRVERAAARLADSDDPLPVVASETGFVTPDRMTRAFRAELETTPQEFRMRGAAAPGEC
ncbi:MAG: substrate-binding domain-containing protein [Phycisphaerales bacterium]|nr:substrate-binding domain-containing protein [Phycisphaerales bacterium]